MWHPLSSSSSVVLAKARVRVAPPLVPLHFHSSFLRPCHSREGGNPCGTPFRHPPPLFLRRRESVLHRRSSLFTFIRHSCALVIPVKARIHAAPLFIQPYIHSLFLCPRHSREGENPCGTTIRHPSSFILTKAGSMRHRCSYCLIFIRYSCALSFPRK